jgi:acyl carrier protein
MVHICFGCNTTPFLESNQVENNMVLSDFVVDDDQLIEDLEEEFGIVLTEDQFGEFNTVGDIVRWVEQSIQ